MANTTKEGTGVVTIVPDGITDWVWSGDLSFPINGTGGLRVSAIEFKASAANDVMVVRDRTATGPILFTITVASTAEDAANRETYSGPKGSGKTMYPYINHSDCTFSNAANCLIRFELV